MLSAAAHCSHSAFNCLLNRSEFRPKPVPNRKRSYLRVRFGVVRMRRADGPESNGSAPLSFDYGPILFLSPAAD